jgi:hypothetical protein
MSKILLSLHVNLWLSLEHTVAVTGNVLEVIPVHGPTNGEDIYCELEKISEKCEFPLNTLACLVTDGSPAVTCFESGIVGKLSEKLEGIVHSLYCIIHQEVLFG